MLVKQLTLLMSKMIGLLEEDQCDQILFVQSNTFNFLQTICSLYLPIYLPGLHLAETISFLSTEVAAK
jgi:hypothetical protein